MVRDCLTWFVCATALATSAFAQTPQPFPRANTPAPPPAAAPAPRPQAPAPAAPQSTAPVQAPSQAPAQPAAAAAARLPGEPDAASLGVPLYPGAQYLTSYDAGRGQRYYLYGATVPFAELVTYYRTQLKERGNLVFEDPPTHMFEVGRFREETMAFPPGVTLKDWTFAGSQGYPNPRRGAQPARFVSVIMIVPPPPAAAAAR
jgi:hypothetical protein